jgi:hypothetical protein
VREGTVLSLQDKQVEPKEEGRGRSALSLHARAPMVLSKRGRVKGSSWVREGAAWWCGSSWTCVCASVEEW